MNLEKVHAYVETAFAWSLVPMFVAIWTLLLGYTFDFAVLRNAGWWLIRVYVYTVLPFALFRSLAIVISVVIRAVGLGFRGHENSCSSKQFFGNRIQQVRLDRRKHSQ